MANQKGKSKYTRAQKRAYYSGMGYATLRGKKVSISIILKMKPRLKQG